MNQLKKVFCALAVVVTLGLLTVSTASAQVMSFSVFSGGSRNVRLEGTAEAMGSVILSLQSGGGTVIPVGTVISVDFGTPIVVDPGNPATTFTGKATYTPTGAGAGGLQRPAATNCNQPKPNENNTGLPALTGALSGTPPTSQDCIVESVSGSVYNLTFIDDVTVAGRGVTTAAGLTITLAGVRVNANAHGAGAINATVNATVPGGAVFITFASSQSVTVANVQSAPSLSSKFEVLTTSGASTAGLPVSLLLCSTTATQTVRVSVTENFAQAFLSRSEEALAGGFVGNNAATASQPSIRFALSGVPAGVQITATIGSSTTGTEGNAAFPGAIPPVAGITSPSLNTANGGAAAAPGLGSANLADQNGTTRVYQVISDGSTINIDAQLGTNNSSNNPATQQSQFTDQSNNETLAVVIQFSIPDATKLSTTATTSAPAKVTVSFKGTTSTPGFPTFVSGGANVEGTSNIFKSGACASYLLYPFVAVGSGFETGMSLANTGLDPAAIGTTGSTPGDCTLSFFPSDASAAVNVDKSSLASLGGIKPGATVSFTASQALGSKPLATGTGYAIAVCNFQLAHGFAIFFQGSNNLGSYLALAINSPRIQGGATTESAGQ